MTQTVTREIVLGDPVRAGRGHRAVLRLSWSPADPLAVVLVVAAKPDHPSMLRGRWVVLRDRLRDVLSGRSAEPPAGAGHVQVSLRGGRVTFTLRGAMLPCVVSVPSEPLHAFLAETDLIVPPGREGCGAALDAELPRLLDPG